MVRSSFIARQLNRIAPFAPFLTTWPGVLICVLIVRLLLNVPALVAVRYTPLQAPHVYSTVEDLNPLTFPGVWSRWDSGYYLGIAANGYSYHGKEVSFWPGFPLAMRILSFGSVSALPWIGVGISLLSFLAASVLLWKQVSVDFDPTSAWDTIIILNLFPTSFFFSAVYTESMFLLLSVLVYWFSARKHYALAAIFVALASITRVYGILLIVLLMTEMVSDRAHRGILKIMFIIGIAFSLLTMYAGFLWATQGSPFVAVFSQYGDFERAVTWPGLSLVHGLAVAFWGHGGFRDNWFMRVASAQDSLAMLLFLVCTIVAFHVLRRKSLVMYGSVAMLALSASHGPYALGVYSMSRYVLTMFPAFIVMALILKHFPKLKWFIWVSMGLLLCLLTAWFATGRWVA